MSQTDMNVANASGAVVRADMNAHFDALVTLSSGATVPTTTFAFMWWADTSTGLLKQRNAANSAFVTKGTLADAFLNNIVEDTTPQQGGVLDTNAFAIDESEGTPTASAATTDIWVTDGNTLHITGTTTITSFATAPRIGAWRKVIFDGVLTLTDGANLNLPGAANITTAADDFAWVYAETTTLFKVMYFKEDGTAVVAAAAGGLTLLPEVTTTSGTTATISGIPASATMVVLTIENLSASGAGTLLLKLGDAGGIESTGYLGQGGKLETAGTYANLITTVNFRLSTVDNLNDLFSGHVTFFLKDAANFTWTANWSFAEHAQQGQALGGGVKSLSAALSQIELSGITFDLGSIGAAFL